MMGLPQSWRPVSHEQGDTAVHPPVGWALLSTCWPSLDPCPSLCHRGALPSHGPGTAIARGGHCGASHLAKSVR